MPNPNQTDFDSDNVGNECDNCDFYANPGQEDADGNGIGDVCDWICGDVNNDETINILDIIFLIDYKFKGGPAPENPAAADVNIDAAVNILDIIYLIDYKFKGGSAPNCL